MNRRNFIITTALLCPLPLVIVRHSFLGYSLSKDENYLRDLKNGFSFDRISESKLSNFYRHQRSYSVLESAYYVYLENLNSLTNSHGSKLGDPYFHKGEGLVEVL